MPDLPSPSDLLAPGGPVSAVLPHFEGRPQQQAMAAGVTRALEANRIALIEAGTGTGKSLGYLFAAVLFALKHRKPAVVSSSTHVLQDQLIRKDIPLVQKVLAGYSVEFEAAEVKGWGAYLCKAALAGPISLEFGKLEDIDGLVRWSEHAVEGTRSEAPAVDAEVWGQFAAQPDTCTRDKCNFFESCFLFKARRRIAESQLLVTNHSLVFADLAVKADGGQVLPDYSLLILDEAHNVEQAATNFLGTSFTPRGLRMLIHRLADGHGKGALAMLDEMVGNSKQLPSVERRKLPVYVQQQVYPELARAEQAIDTAFQDIEDVWREVQGPRRERAETLPGASEERGGRGSSKALRLTDRIYAHPAFPRAEAAAGFLAARLELAVTRVHEFLQRAAAAEDLLALRHFTTVRSACRSLIERAQQMKEFFDKTTGAGETVKWIEGDHSRKGFQLRLAMAPLDVGPHLEQRLFKKLDSCILTSATLAVGRDFHYVRSRLGLNDNVAERVDGLLLDSPFDFQSNVLVGIPDDLPEPGHADFIREAARFIWQALKVSRGRSLVLFHSWYTLRATYKLMAPHEDQLGFRLLCQGQHRMSRNELIETFRSDVHSALFATASYREGIDVPGAALSNLILHRLPFPVPDEPVIEARMEQIELRGGSSFNEYEVPAAVIAFKQAFGRLIRSHTDYGLFLCCDKRVMTKRYGASFLQTLPRCQIARGSRNEVLGRAAAFLRRKDGAMHSTADEQQ